MQSFLLSVAKNVLRLASWNWEPYSRLLLHGGGVGWSLDWDMRELAQISRKLGIRLANPYWKYAGSQQSIFFASQFFLTKDNWLRLLPNRIAFSYFHGLPNTGDELFDAVYRSLCIHHNKIRRIQVTHSQMKEAILETDIDPLKVFLIPIGINLKFFPYRNDIQKMTMRDELGIPQSAFVIGSFQKDGVGWGEGLEPKLIKGPDVFLSALKQVQDEIPELFVLLTGPSRGYVKLGLDEIKIPYKHTFLNSYPDVAKMYQASDMYMVASRQEGGPKAILESMASGVPLVTTKVGQATDIVHHGQNAWIVDVENVDGLAEGIRHVYGMGQTELQSMLRNGRATAEANSYETQIPLWADFMKGFVEAG